MAPMKSEKKSHDTKKPVRTPEMRRKPRVRRTKLSDALFERAIKKLPGGVNSPVRSFASVGGKPFFVKKGRGATLTDVDGNRYVDFVMSYGPLIFGHAYPAVATAVRKALALGTSYGAPHKAEIELAEKLCRAVPSMEKVRFVSSGT